MLTSRRTFLHVSSFATLAVGAGTPSSVLGDTPVDTVPRAGDPALRELTMRALDAARSAGASYADVRLVVTRIQRFNYGNPPIDSETISAGVRALVNGVWGFSASPLWTLDEMARLGQDAAQQAKANHWNGVPPVELGPPPQPATGIWTAPVARDPFVVSIDEKLDFINALKGYVSEFKDAGTNPILVFQRQERTFASTEGALCTQTVYNSLGNSSFLAIGVHDFRSGKYGIRYAPEISPSGAGYEALSESTLVERLPRYVEEARAMFDMQPVAPSRYDVVFDGAAMAPILSATIGAASELDRVLGYEANASGTSYLAPMSRMLGHPVGAPLLNVIADRTYPGAVATTRWDDDGVRSSSFPIVTDGMLVDYATSREHSSALSAWYNAHQKPIQSNGCAGSGDAMRVPMIQTPNLHMLPSAKNATVEDLIREVDDGIFIKGGGCIPDQQLLNGQAIGEVVYRIKKGKLAGTLKLGTGFLFRSPEFWNNIAEIGDASTVVQRGLTMQKGQPEQTIAHSVRTPAALVRGVSVLDLMPRMRAAASA